MKLKRLSLYIIVTICFVLVFVGLNMKYDRFYRVNGIDNDNRALIERYLDEDEQDYLVDNAIPVSKFIDYIEEKDFKLQNYTYYNALKSTKEYSSNSEIISVGNNIVNLLTTQYGNRASTNFNTLMHDDLIKAYLSDNQNFDFDNCTYYQRTKIIYDDNDYTYISDTNNYVKILEDINENMNLDKTFKSLVNNYSKDSLKVLLTTQIPENVSRIVRLSPLTSVVNSSNFIGSCEPERLNIIEGVPRVKYSIYLQRDAYTNLLNMYKDMKESIKGRFIVQQGYVDYNTLQLENNATAGYSELQLGTTVKLSIEGYSDEDFGGSEVSKWLMENSYKYGYILRYPSGKEATTGVNYNPTLYRYVGVENATKIKNNNQCLEEFKD